jgi:hypothetical protein
MTKASKASKKVTVTIPAVNTAWKTLVTKTKKTDEESALAVVNFAKTIASRKVDLRNARKSIEELGLKSPVLHTSQIEALPVLLELMAKEKGYAEFHALNIKEKLTKATAAYKLGVEVATKFPTYEALTKEIKEFNARKNNKNKEPKPAKGKKGVTVEQSLKATIALIEGLGDGIEDSVYDLLIELNKVTAEKVGVDA